MRTAPQAITFLTTIYPEIDWRFDVELRPGCAGRYLFDEDPNEPAIIEIGFHSPAVGLMVVLHELGHYHDFQSFDDWRAFKDRPYETKETCAMEQGWRLVQRHDLEHLVSRDRWDRFHYFIHDDREFESCADYLAHLGITEEETCDV